MKAYRQQVAGPGESSFVYRWKVDRRFARGWHYHPEYELTYIVSSQGRRLVGDSVENYRSGDLVLLGPGLPHTWLSADGDEDRGAANPGGRARARGRGKLHRATVVQFRGDFLGADFFDAPELAAVKDLLQRSSRGIQVLGRTREATARRLVGMRSLGRSGRLLELLAALERLAGGGADLREICSGAGAYLRRPGAGDGRDRRRIDRVLAFLHDRYTDDVSQGEAAALAGGLSAAGFSRFFKRATGSTFTAYLSNLRITHACHLLADTDRPVTEVCYLSGFNNLANFNRRFLKIKGTTPSAYRRRRRG